MKIKNGDFYFTFKLTGKDKREYPYINRWRFLNAIKDKIDAADRYFSKDSGEWTIKNSHRNTFLNIVNKYLTDSQLSLF